MFLLFVFVFNSSFGLEMKLPKDFGIERPASYYDSILSQQDSTISLRGASMITSCREELRLSNDGQRCVDIDDLTFPCGKKYYLTSGKINFCVEKGKSLITINKKMSINYNFRKRNKDPKIKLKLKKMFNSAVTCMKSFYKKSGIHLNLTLTEVPYESYSDITVTELSLKGASFHRIPLGKVGRYYSHGELCQIVTHEFSHHFALPDRYQMRKPDGSNCELQPVYPPETIMATSMRNGLAGYSALKFHEHDIADMLYYVCPKTVRYYNKNKDMTCSDNYDYLHKEGFFELIDSLRDVIFKYKKRH